MIQICQQNETRTMTLVSSSVENEHWCVFNYLSLASFMAINGTLIKLYTIYLNLLLIFKVNGAICKNWLPLEFILRTTAECFCRQLTVQPVVVLWLTDCWHCFHSDYHLEVQTGRHVSFSRYLCTTVHTCLTWWQNISWHSVDILVRLLMF